MKRMALIAMFLALLSGQARAANYDFPNAPTANQIVSGPNAQQFQWDGTKWVAIGGSIYAPLNNVAGGAGNYAPLSSPSLSNPTFTGTLNFPDGSNYSSAGHNSVKALGIGAPAAAANTLILGNTTSPSIYWGSPTAATASVTSAGSSNLNLFAGAHYGPNWVADAATAEQIAMYNAPAINFGINSGLTVGSTFTPTWIASITPTGLNITTGTLFLNGANQFQSGSFTPVLTCLTTPPAAITPGSQIGNWWTAGNSIFFNIQVYWNSESGGSGQAVVTGLPFAATRTGGGQGGTMFNVISTNMGSTRGAGSRVIATVFNGESQIRLYDSGPGVGGDFLSAATCANVWANTPSGIFINGTYAYQ